jgi:phosphocarrier protein
MAFVVDRPGRIHPHLGDWLMPERIVQIVNRNGLHARPAAEIVKTAAKFQSEITIVKDDLDVNGKSIMGVMMLAAECGSSITLRADGPDAEQALDALATLVCNKFGER